MSESLKLNGGALSAESLSSLTVKSSSFISCTAFWGGGAFIHLITTTPILSECDFLSCKADQLGCGVFLGSCKKSSSFVACSNCRFLNGVNLSSNLVYGGGLLLDIYGTDHVNTVSNLLFTKNSVNKEAGGLRVYESTSQYSYSVKFCFFSDNYATSGGDDISFCNALTNSIIHSFTASHDRNTIYVLPPIEVPSISTNPTTTPNWLPHGTIIFPREVHVSIKLTNIF